MFANGAASAAFVAIMGELGRITKSNKEPSCLSSSDGFCFLWSDQIDEEPLLAWEHGCGRMCDARHGNIPDNLHEQFLIGGAFVAAGVCSRVPGMCLLGLQIRNLANPDASVFIPGGVAKSANPKVKEVLNSIGANGYKVKINPKNPATKQEVNATIDFGDKTKVNLRVESHPLKQNGPDVRHANVEVTRQVKNKNKVIRNDHIID